MDEKQRRELLKLLDEWKEKTKVELAAVRPAACTCGAQTDDNENKTFADALAGVQQSVVQLGTTIIEAFQTSEPESPDKPPAAKVDDAISEDRRTRIALAKFGSRLPSDFDAAADDLKEIDIVKAALGDDYVEGDSDARNIIRLELKMEQEDNAAAPANPQPIRSNLPSESTRQVFNNGSESASRVRMPRGGWRKTRFLKPNA